MVQLIKTPCFMVQRIINTMLFGTSDYKHYVMWYNGI